MLKLNNFKTFFEILLNSSDGRVSLRIGFFRLTSRID
jgi:hypothetical protein